MKLSKKIKIELFTLLIVLNLILRIPFFPHEYGADSFEIHILANSVSEFGYAKWWVEPLSSSIPGSYPYSECSAVPFALSGISQTTGIDTEKVILLFCIILGLFTVFAAYILAGVIWNNDLFKFLVAFGLSTSPAILNYLTWTITTRAPFIALLPLFAYSLLKCRTYKLRFAFLTIILFILLFVTHQLAYFLIPVFIGCLTVVAAYQVKEHIKFVKIPEKFVAFVLIIGFLIMFAIPFQTGHFIVGSRYAAAPDLLFGNLPRYVGVLLIFAFGGFTYLLFKRDKKFGEWSLLLIMLFLTPFLYAQTYMKWFIPCFIFPFAGIGLINIAKLDGQKRKYALALIVIFLLLSVSFSGFYQHWRTKGGEIHLFDGYTKESTYTTGLWIKENTNNGSLISNDKVFGFRIFAVSEVPLLTGSGEIDQVYGFVNVSELELKKRSITEEKYWSDGPYEIIGGLAAENYWHRIMNQDYENYKLRYFSKFNFTHVIEDKRMHGKWRSRHGVVSSPFLHHIYTEKESIYDNGNINVWSLI